MFIFSCPETYSQGVVLIQEDPSGYEIQHQYGCVGCDQFKTKGFVSLLPEDLQEKLLPVLDRLCSYSEPSMYIMKQIEDITGWKVVEVLGEALVKLESNRYLATSNCD